jgi:hypothetical protein
MAANKRAAKEPVAGQECPLEARVTKRRAADAAAAGGKCPPKPRITKKKAKTVATGLAADAESVVVPAAATKGEQAPARKMTRLPKKEVEWILAQVETKMVPLLRSRP